MSIAEKLVKVAENQEKVFAAGKNAVVNELKEAQKGTASGEVISITDISPIEHTLGVKVSDANAILSVCGKNLFKSTDYTKGTLDANTGGITSSAQTKLFCLITDYIYLKSGAYVLSNIVGANLRYIAFYDLDKGFKSATWTGRAKTFKFTITEDCYVRIDIERDANVNIDNFDTFCDEYEFMLEVGTSATGYEPYIELTTFTPNADGTVEGVKSIYPTTTLLTDTSGVLIECEYIRGLNGVVNELTDAIISLGGDI